ncbi:hypothetical protein CMV_003959 [Castanea mollissima]|uniref:Uncharacterized protein n=1 Tax=Castanea mollissima TaxID=60419 RepID=A0A8J4RGH2_9ROSI|nr:hypothetical protein CMV_003959 [Castanea mollissima]
MEETQREFHHEEEEEHADINIWKYIMGFSELAVVKCAIDLGIADAIESHGRPITLSDLSSTLGCAPSPLYRIMRFLMHRGIFKEKLTTQGSPGYAQTPLSRRLMRQGEHSMAALILLESSPVMLAPWLSLSAQVLANGTSSFEKAHGKDLWSYTAANPDHSQLFNEAMACDARLVVQAMIQEISGVENVGGDMFESVPKADAAFILWVLHDWADKECIQILKKCKEAIPEDKGKVIIVDAVIQEQEEMDKLTDARLMLDMVIMAHTTTGKERTLKEWGFVLGEAGFSRYTVKPIRAMQSVIVAFP